MDNLKDLIKEIQAYKKELSLNSLTDDKILEVAGKIFISNNINLERKGYRHEHQEQKDKVVNYATDEQKAALKKFGIKFDEKISKKEAYEILKEKFK